MSPSGPQRTLFEALLLGAAALLAGFGARAAEPAPIVAIGDIHGAYAELGTLLRTARLVDADLRWAGGAARLVLLGDVVDRGPGSRRALELIMRLQQEAPRSGGSVRLVLGNHEVMNLLGDVRYVSPADFAAYADDEPAGARTAAWSRFSAAHGGRDDAELRETFAMRFPPGFFGQRAAFSRHGELGAWLLEQPVIATLDRTAFVHGGLPPAAMGRSAAELNAEYGAALHEYADAVERLTAAGVLYPEQSADERAAGAARFAAQPPDSASGDGLRQAAERVVTLSRSALFGDDALFWYRGTAACAAAIERDRLRAELAKLGVDRVVIGHTPTPSARIEARFDGDVIRADTGMLAAYFGGRPSAVVIQGADVRALYLEGGAAPLPEPRAVGHGRALGSDDSLEQKLRELPLPQRGGAATLPFDAGGGAAAAVYRRDRGALREVAAYRLDRLLGLELVPVAVVRTLGSRVGSLALDVGALPDEQQRRARGAGALASCPLADQIDLMYVFDMLTGNAGRSAAEIRYLPGSWQLVLAGNGGLFGAQAKGPGYAAAAKVTLTPYLRERLAALDLPMLERELGDILSARELGAILARRDRLLAAATRSSSERPAEQH